jgi:hypothetical protein
MNKKQILDLLKEILLFIVVYIITIGVIVLI